MKKFLVFAALIMGAVAVPATAQTASAAIAPATVIHIINVKWKEDATPEQIQAALDAVRQLPVRFPGIKHVWTRDIKYQGQEGYKQAIVLEFESQDALKKYEDSAAQQWWYRLYLPVRDESRTHDVTN